MLENFKLKYFTKKHRFYLKEIRKISSLHSCPLYQCRNCNRSLLLEHWQIKELPVYMAYGCKNEIKN